MYEAYLAHLPADLRPDPLPARTSAWWEWRDMEVHVLQVGEPAAPVRAIVLHGGGGHSAALWPHAAALAARGMYVVLPDLPGYGKTRVPRPNLVRYPDWVDLACDFVVSQRRESTAPLLLIGASMGGMLAYEAASRTGAADGVVVTALLDPRDPAVRRHVARYRWLGAVAQPVLRTLAGPLAGMSVPMRWLANMRAIANAPVLVDLVVHDPLGGGARMPLGFLRSFLDSAPAVEPEAVTRPMFVLAHPAEDRWTPVSLSERFFTRITGPRRMVFLEGAGHFPVESPGVHQFIEAVDRLVRDIRRLRGTP